MFTRLPSCKITGAILVALVLFTFGMANAPKAQAAPYTGRTLPLCLSDEGESAFPCVWVAFAQGNHKGHSFRIYRDGRVKQISDARAFELAGDCDANGPLYCRTGS